MNYSIFYSKFKGAALLSYSKFKVQLLFVIIYFTLEKKKEALWLFTNIALFV